MIEITCKKCGEKFTVDKGPNRKYCSPECNPWVVTSEKFIHCVTCGKPIQRKSRNGPFPKYCSERCKQLACHNRNPGKHSNPCAHCGKPTPIKEGSKVNKYCSPECRSNAAFKNQERECAVCGKIYKSRNPSKCCSQKCQQVATQRTLEDIRRKENSIERICSCCGDVFFVSRLNMGANYCSKSCSDKVWSKKRRALVAGAETEDFSMAEIYKRDAWRCKICGKKIDKNHKWPHPLSGSIDHILPLSKGGPHTKENVRLAHLGCNSAKGNRYVMATESGQLTIVI